MVPSILLGSSNYAHKCSLLKGKSQLISHLSALSSIRYYSCFETYSLWSGWIMGPGAHVSKQFLCSSEGKLQSWGRDAFSAIAHSLIQPAPPWPFLYNMTVLTEDSCQHSLVIFSLAIGPVFIHPQAWKPYGTRSGLRVCWLFRQKK